MHTERTRLAAAVDAALIAGGGQSESMALDGRYEVECFDADGNLKWRDVVENLVVNAGGDLVLDTFLGGASYTAVGPFMFLVGATPSVAAGDTMSSHAGWTEVGGANAPTYSGNRGTPSWSAASAKSKSTSSAVSFSLTDSGTVGGCGLVLGTGAVNTKDSTAGTLYSVGAFSGGNRTVANGDTLNVSYTGSA